MKNLNDPYTIGELQGLPRGGAQVIAKLAMDQYAKRYASMKGIPYEVAKHEVFLEVYNRAYIHRVLDECLENDLTPSDMAEIYQKPKAWFEAMAAAANLNGVDYATASNKQLLDMVEGAIVEPVFASLPGFAPALEELIRRERKERGSVLPHSQWIELLWLVAPYGAEGEFVQRFR